MEQRIREWVELIREMGGEHMVDTEEKIELLARELRKHSQIRIERLEDIIRIATRLVETGDDMGLAQLRSSAVQLIGRKDPFDLN